MPNSLKCRLKNLVRNELLRKRDLKRIIIIPPNATNGEVIKAVFPNIEREDNYGDADFYLLNGKSAYTPKLITFKSWWNTSYEIDREVEE